MEQRPMRRKDRQLDQQETQAILQNGEWGILATASADGLPLATPLSYVYTGGKLYFHCAMKGHKLDNIAAQSAVSFCVVGKTQPVYDNDYTTYFESAVAQGTASFVADEAEKAEALRLLCEKYLPEHMDAFDGAMEKSGRVTVVVRIDVENLTGKAKRPKP